MVSDLEIRSMAERDLDAVLAIQSSCYTEVAPETLHSIRAKLVASSTTCFVAVASGEVVGYLIALPWEFANPPVLNLERCELPQRPDCLYLHDLAVVPKARGLGVGVKLVETFFKVLERLRLPRAALIAVQGSSAYWERFGFQIASTDADLRAKLLSYGTHVVYMELVTC